MYGIVYDPRIALYPPRVSLALRIEVSTPCGALLTRGTTVFVPPGVRWICRCMEGFMIRGWNLILTGWRWLYDPLWCKNEYRRQ